MGSGTPTRTPARGVAPDPPAQSSTGTSTPRRNRDTIKVIARFRPELEKEKHWESKSTLQIIDNKSLSLGGDVYTYDRVFGPTASQLELFEYSVEPTVDDLFAGYNGTVLAYGQTGSGKTFTMMGPKLHGEMKGVVPRIVDALFDRISAEQKSQKVDATEYTLTASYMEIYMEQVKDLLNSESDLPLTIHEDGANGIHVRNLTKKYAGSSEELYAILEKGAQLRAVGSTEMNQESSRSHTIFQLDLTQENIREGVKRSKLFLVDLAGSEKVGNTGASGQTFEEAKKINSSLTQLGIVINALTDNKSSHIPYRDSKLTRILQQSLGGNSRTSLIVNCSPAAYNETETVSTLRFGTRAKKIKNTAHINSEPSQLDILERIDHLTRLNEEHVLRAKELEFELDLWKSGFNRLDKEPVAKPIPPPPPPPPPKDLTPKLSVEDVKKIPFLENRIQELTAMISRVPSLKASEEDQPLAYQLEASQAMNAELIQDLNEKCVHLFEMQQEIDNLTTEIQNQPPIDTERLAQLEQSIGKLSLQMAEIQNHNHMLQKEILTTRKISETRQERIKTLEELLKEAQSKVQSETANFEFKLFSLRERLSTVRKLSSSTVPSYQYTGSLSAGQGMGAGMSKIDEENALYSANMTDFAPRRSNSGSGNASSDELSMKGSNGSSTSRRTSIASSATSGGNAGYRSGFSLNVVKPVVDE